MKKFLATFPLLLLFFTFAPIAHAAIARDNSDATLTFASTPTSISYTTSGTGILLLVSFRAGTASDIVTGVTYGGQAMSFVHKGQFGGGAYVYLYSLFDAPSGANNIVIDTSSSIEGQVLAWSYNGVGSAIDVHNYQTGFGGSSPFTFGVTPTGANEWVIGWLAGDAGGFTASTGASQVAQTSTGSNWNTGIAFDSNGTVASGSLYNQSITFGTTPRNWTWAQIAVAPIVVYTPPVIFPQIFSWF